MMGPAKLILGLNVFGLHSVLLVLVARHCRVLGVIVVVKTNGRCGGAGSGVRQE